MFDLETLKEKLDGETLSALGNHIADLEGKVKTVRKKADTADAATAKAAQLEARILEKLGIESLDDLDTIPDPKASKGDADALKQYEAKLKRIERERDEANKSRDGVIAQMTQAKKQAAIAQALSAGGFHDVRSAKLHLEAATEQQDDDFMFKTMDGRLIPLSDGAKLIATEMPHLVKAPQGTGSGYRDAGGGSSAKTMPKAAFDALKPSERADAVSKGFTITES
jgi:hypothetical protein